MGLKCVSGTNRKGINYEFCCETMAVQLQRALPDSNSVKVFCCMHNGLFQGLYHINLGGQQGLRPYITAYFTGNITTLPPHQVSGQAPGSALAPHFQLLGKFLLIGAHLAFCHRLAVRVVLHRGFIYRRIRTLTYSHYAVSCSQLTYITPEYARVNRTLTPKRLTPCLKRRSGERCRTCQSAGVRGEERTSSSGKT